MSDDQKTAGEPEERVEQVRQEARRLEEAAEKLGRLAEEINEALGKRFLQLFLQAVASYLVLGGIVYVIVRFVLRRNSKAEAPKMGRLGRFF